MHRNRIFTTVRPMAALFGVGLAAAAVVSPVRAEESEMAISYSGGVDYNTHFISYGFDVWGEGDNWGSEATLNPWSEVAASIGDLTLVTGVWADINDNAPASLGGEIQEIDWWIGASYAIDDFTVGATFQAWEYGGGSEKIFDLSLSYDDSGLWGDDGIALNPSVVFHKRLSSSNIGTAPGGDENGWVIVAGIEPGFTVLDSETYPVELTVPVSVGFFLDEGFHGTQVAGPVTDDGFGFLSIGATLSMPLTFIPAEYGAWSIAGGVTYYHTEDDVIGNPDDDFVTGTIGISVGF